MGKVIKMKMIQRIIIFNMIHGFKKTKEGIKVSKCKKRLVSVICSSTMVVGVLSVGLQGVKAESHPYSAKGYKESFNKNIKSIKGITLNEKFDKNRTNYTAVVPRDVTELDLDVETEDPNVWYVSIEGDYDLELGENLLRIKVYANDCSSKTYTINVNRGNLSSNTNIVSIKGVNIGTYSNDNDSYSASVPYETSRLNLKVETEDKTSNVSISNTNLRVGYNVIRVRVTSTDGSRRDLKIAVVRNRAKPVYKKPVQVQPVQVQPVANTTPTRRNVRRTAGNSEVYESAKIKNLSGDFRLIGGFDPDKLNYRTVWRDNVNTFNVTVEKYSEVKVYGMAANGNKLVGTLQSQYEGTNTFQVRNLPKGLNTLKVEVTTPKGFKKVYTLAIRKW